MKTFKEVRNILNESRGRHAVDGNWELLYTGNGALHLMRNGDGGTLSVYKGAKTKGVFGVAYNNKNVDINNWGLAGKPLPMWIKELEKFIKSKFKSDPISPKIWNEWKDSIKDYQ